MKTSTLVLMALCSFAPLLAQAQTAGCAAPTLGSVMKEMSPKYKALGMQITDASKNADSIQLAKDLGILIQTAVRISPDLSSQPVAQQRTEELEFQRMMMQLATSDIDLEEALASGKQDAAAVAYKAMGALKSQGHARFEN